MKFPKLSELFDVITPANQKLILFLLLAALIIGGPLGYYFAQRDYDVLKKEIQEKRKIKQSLMQQSDSYSGD